MDCEPKQCTIDCRNVGLLVFLDLTVIQTEEYVTIILLCMQELQPHIQLRLMKVQPLFASCFAKQLHPLQREKQNQHYFFECQYPPPESDHPSIGVGGLRDCGREKSSEKSLEYCK